MPLRQPTYFIPHGGGPCFFMDDPNGTWTGMAAFLRAIPSQLPEPPKAILIVSGHWESEGFAFTTAAKPPLLFDYYGFPPHTYQLRYDAPGDPALAQAASTLVAGAGFKTGADSERGYDHGVFVPLKVAFPDATIPVVAMSLDYRLDPEQHLAAGRALAPLRQDGILIVGSGMSFHNMRGYRDARFTPVSEGFDGWLTNAVESSADDRAAKLKAWEAAPGARLSHPDAEHLLPLMVAAGASDERGSKVYSEHVMKTVISGFRFD